MKILITGAAGAIGSTLVKGMKDRYSLRGFDCVPTPDLQDTIVGDIADFDAIEKAAAGVDAVIHLANAESLPVGERPRTAGGEADLPSKNFVGMFNVLLRSVKTVCVASPTPAAPGCFRLTRSISPERLI